MKSEAHEWVDTIINGLVAVGTLAAVVAAIFQDQIRAWYHPLKLSLEIPESPTSITTTVVNGFPFTVLLRFLRVVNKSADSMPRHCRVVLMGIERISENHRWAPVPYPVPFQLPWAPQGLHAERNITVVRSEIVDFMQLVPAASPVAPNNYFGPVLYAYPNDFQGRGGPGETLRYLLEIQAENLPRPLSYTFEVSWDGFWAPDTEAMRGHFTVRPIRTAVA